MYNYTYILHVFGGVYSLFRMEINIIQCEPHTRSLSVIVSEPGFTFKAQQPL